MPHLIILDKGKELQECLLTAVSLGAQAHEAVEAAADPNDPLVVVYNELADAIDAARLSVCEASAGLAEKLS